MRSISNKIESKNYLLNQSLDLATNRKYGDMAMRLVVFGWLIFQTYTYHLMADRPEALFAPINWFDKLFMPVFPSIFVWYTICGLAFGLNIVLFFRGENKWSRIVLGILILWVNCIRWKYGFFSHVGHIMVLYHLLGMFLPRKDTISKEDTELADYTKATQWLYIGLLAGYTFSGIWKMIGLAYKIILQPNAINWLHPLAMKVNSIVGYQDWDEQCQGIVSMYDVLWPWQIAFILMLILQVVSVFGGIKPRLAVYIALGNILFHIINVFMIRIEFYLTPTVLLAVFFPYHLLFNKEKIKSENTYSEQGYKRLYEDGTEDVYFGFEAWLEAKHDKNPLVYGVFYFPGLIPLFTFLNRFKK